MSYFLGKYLCTLLPYDLNILNHGIFVSSRKAWKRRAELRIAVVFSGEYLCTLLPYDLNLFEYSQPWHFCVFAQRVEAASRVENRRWGTFENCLPVLKQLWVS